MLFGQGPGAAAAGGFGGGYWNRMGGQMGGFAGGIAATAVGQIQQINQVEKKQEFSK